MGRGRPIIFPDPFVLPRREECGDGLGHDLAEFTVKEGDNYRCDMCNSPFRIGETAKMWNCIFCEKYTLCEKHYLDNDASDAPSPIGRSSQRRERRPERVLTRPRPDFMLSAEGMSKDLEPGAYAPQEIRIPDLDEYFE